MKKKSLWVSLTLLALTFSCTNTSIINNTNPVLKNQSIVTQPITGTATFPIKNNFNIKATVADIGTNATVSLIDTSNNTTLATGLTNASGVFTINSGFTATTGTVYVLEATRRIAGSSNSSMSVRTFIKWNGSSWNSITSPGVSINSRTTALTSMVGLMGTTLVTPDETIGTMPNNTPSDISHNSTVAITSASILEVADLIIYNLANNFDPVFYLKYSSATNKFYLKDPQSLPATIHTLAGNGTATYTGDGNKATGASLYSPTDVVLDSTGNIYIADYNNNRIRKIDVSTGNISTVAGGSSGGDGGLATAASLNQPKSVAIDSNGNIFIADTSNHKIRRVDNITKNISTIAGNGSPTGGANPINDGANGTTASLNNPSGVAVDSSGNVYIADTLNRRIRRVDATTNIITTVAGDGTFSFSGDGGNATAATLKNPTGITLDSKNNIYIADYLNHRIRKVDATTNIITTVVGNGTGTYAGDNGNATDASLNFPSGVAVDSRFNLYITDQNNNRIRKVDSATNIISTIAGNGTGTFAGDGISASDSTVSLNAPNDLTVDLNGNIFVADQVNNRVRKIGTKEVNPK